MIESIIFFALLIGILRIAFYPDTLMRLITPINERLFHYLTQTHKDKSRGFTVAAMLYVIATHLKQYVFITFCFITGTICTIIFFAYDWLIRDNPYYTLAHYTSCLWPPIVVLIAYQYGWYPTLSNIYSEFEDLPNSMSFSSWQTYFADPPDWATKDWEAVFSYRMGLKNRKTWYLKNLRNILKGDLKEQATLASASFQGLSDYDKWMKMYLKNIEFHMDGNEPLVHAAFLIPNFAFYALNHPDTKLEKRSIKLIQEITKRVYEIIGRTPVSQQQHQVVKPLTDKKETKNKSCVKERKNFIHGD